MNSEQSLARRASMGRRVAYLGLFAMMAGDTVRYLVDWAGWGTLIGLLFIWASYLFIKGEPKPAIKQMPLPLKLILGLMLISSLWASTPALTALIAVAQIAQTMFGLYLAVSYSWRELLRIFGNTLRFILGTSIVFEFIAAAFVRGPIPPIFANNLSGDQHAWTRGHLFDGERIQGILGNSNLLAALAMLGIVIFAIEYVVNNDRRWIYLSSLLLAGGTVYLSKSAGVFFAVLATAIAATVALFVEGRDRTTRHKTYRWVWLVAGVIGGLAITFRVALFTFIGKSPDMTGRTKIWKLVLGLIQQRPIQGWGWVSYWVPGIKPYAGLVRLEGIPYYQAHNAFLDAWLQIGIVGVLLLLWLVVQNFVRLWRLAVRHTNPLYLWPMLVFIALLSQNLTESRMLLEYGWVIVVMLGVKVADPIESLEPGDGELKRVRLLDLGLQRNRSRQRKDH
ncbi:MAG: O-antigen ligase family protein [Micrococcales bacterium]